MSLLRLKPLLDRWRPPMLGVLTGDCMVMAMRGVTPGETACFLYTAAVSAVAVSRPHSYTTWDSKDAADDAS